MSRPGWARSCTCSKTPTGYFCGTCNAFNGGMPDDVAHHNGPTQRERLRQLTQDSQKAGLYEKPKPKPSTDRRIWH